MQVSAFLKRWLAQAKGDLRPNTFRLYSHVVNAHIVPHLKKVTVGGFRSPNARAFLAKLEEQGVSPSIRREVHKVMRRAFQVAVNDETIPRNPLATVTRPRVEPKSEYVLNRNEAAKLLDVAAKTRWHLLIRMALTTGMREGELLGLTPIDLKLDVAEPHLFVNATLTEQEDGTLARTPPKTKSSQRRVELDETTANMLRAAAEGLGRSEFVFTDSLGNPVRKSNFLRRDWAPMVERAGLPHIRFHSLRKVANSLLLASGDASLLDLQNRLGHATPAMTLKTYARALPDAQRRIAAVAGDLFEVESEVESVHLTAEQRTAGHEKSP
ncbi:MAG: tyrosine-type recombinase/integrase [Vulcanimicrobiaceae bacterium]